METIPSEKMSMLALYFDLSLLEAEDATASGDM